MNRIQKSFFLSFLFISLVLSGFSQKKIETQKDINLKVEYVNNLIWHYNYNIRALKNFQQELTIWFENPNRISNEMPNFDFMTYSGEKVKIKQESRANYDLFSYDSHLDKLEKEILQFNLNYKKIQNTSFSDKTSLSESNYINTIYDILNSIYKQSINMAEISYDFSRACAVNYKSDEYPSELGKVKNLVSQSKNLILALRDNNPKLVKEYLALLNNGLSVMKSSTNVREIYLITKSKLSLEELNSLTQEIYQKANNIAAIGELYIQSNYTLKEANMLLNQAITEFNEAEGKSGCASGFNTIISFSESDLMFFTEEPNTIVVDKIIPARKNINNITEISGDAPNTTIPTIINTPEPEVAKEEPVKEVFDIKNNNSLAGSLPTNLIILLDVSVSMKKSEKLPILKESISHFLNLMRSEDKISLIAYSGKTQILVSGASNKDKTAIIDTLNKVKSSGGSDLYTALKEAYEIGNENFIAQGNNKIIIASDGIFGVDFKISKLVKEKAEKNFSLSVFHYSDIKEEINFKSLKNLAEIGKGSYRVIYNNQEAIEAMMIEIKKQDFED